MLSFGLLKSISCILTVKKMMVKIFRRRNSKSIHSNENCRQKVFKMPCDSQWIDLLIELECCEIKKYLINIGFK